MAGWRVDIRARNCGTSGLVDAPNAWEVWRKPRPPFVARPSLPPASEGGFSPVELVASMPKQALPATRRLPGCKRRRVAMATYCELVIVKVALEACSGGRARACSHAMCIMVPAEMIARSGTSDG